MSAALKAAHRTLRGGHPLSLTQVSDLMQEGIDASVVEQEYESEEHPGFHIIDEKDFAGSYSEDQDA